MSVTVVQPFFECRSDCILRNAECEGVCAVTLALTDDEWWALLKKYDHMIYVTSPDCLAGVDPGFVLLEKTDRYWAYGPGHGVADIGSALGTSAALLQLGVVTAQRQPEVEPARV